ncbi:hypothetical protein Slin15195_G088160 [Septoria linicola]|uniref:Uncharacterized protein n=1 Tax=Septoria linicola TaxID=215465 RepID=A0A9Q9B115_9PEZI|nr:hypothetical protein Slin14017_G090770 [Septoria linicola]USW55497.1 hypothetical protein Slin15195_G088160 [Septoria linicola]
MAGLVVLQAAQLGFITPNGLFGAFEPGSQVNVSWTSPWPLTTLEIWRGPSQDDGSYNVDVLGANLTSSTTSYPYQVPGASSEENAFSPQVYFRLQKSDMPNQCENCVASSPVFQIAAAGAALPPSGGSSASESSAAATPTTAATTAAVVGGIATTSAASTESESATSAASEAASSTAAEAESSTTAEAVMSTTEAASSMATDATTSMAESSVTSMAESSAASMAESTPSGMTTMVSSTLADSASSTTSAEPFVFTPVGSRPFDRATELGLGIGLGLGIPIMLVIMGLLVVCLNRRERRRIQEKQFEGVFHTQ